MPQRLPPLTIQQILKWADQYYEFTGQWPTSRHGRVLGEHGLKWETINDALRKGQRGLPGGSSLARVLKKHRHTADPRRIRPDISRKQIIEWIRDHHLRTGQWPQRDSGRVLSAPDISWSTVSRLLESGGPNLPGGESLKDLLHNDFGLWSSRGNRPLSEAMILKWTEQYKARCGKWPIVMSGSIPSTDGDTWAAINEALVHGRRGLPGGSSLAKLLTKHFGPAYRPTAARLSEKQILLWAREHYRTTGKWPTAKSGPCKPARISWALIDRCLRRGEQELPGGSSLSALLKDNRRSAPSKSVRIETKPKAPKPAPAPSRKRGRKPEVVVTWSQSSAMLPDWMHWR